MEMYQNNFKVSMSVCLKKISIYPVLGVYQFFLKKDFHNFKAGFEHYAHCYLFIFFFKNRIKHAGIRGYV